MARQAEGRSRFISGQDEPYHPHSAHGGAAGRSAAGCELMSLFVFGYGSLMWRPGFPFEERHLATIRGRHRRLCVLSFVHRGTEARPGLVLGLDRGGACRGVVFRVAEENREEVIAYLRARELVTNVYVERVIPAILDDGRVVDSLAYVVDRTHRQYAGRLSLDETLARVRGAVGKSGRNEDYVISTADHLTECGVADPRLHTLAARLRECGTDGA